MGLDTKVVLKWFDKFPKMETFIGAGAISKKMARDILDIDKYLMDDAVNELVCAGAIKMTSSAVFRASEDLQTLLAERRANNDVK